MKNAIFRKKIAKFLFSQDLLHCTEGGVYRNLNFSQKVAITPRGGIFDHLVKNLNKASRGFKYKLFGRLEGRC